MFTTYTNRSLRKNLYIESTVLNHHLSLTEILAFSSEAPLTGDSERCCHLSCDSQYVTSLLKSLLNGSESHRNKRNLRTWETLSAAELLTFGAKLVEASFVQNGKCQLTLAIEWACYWIQGSQNQRWTYEQRCIHLLTYLMKCFWPNALEKE